MFDKNWGSARLTCPIDKPTTTTDYDNGWVSDTSFSRSWKYKHYNGKVIGHNSLELGYENISIYFIIVVKEINYLQASIINYMTFSFLNLYQHN